MRLHEDPNLYGRVPDPPERDCPGETEGRMIEETCYYCTRYQECKETLKEISSELEKMIDEHDGVDPYEMGISVGLSMARVVISNRRLDLEGIPR